MNSKILIIANSDLTFDQRLQRIGRSLVGAGFQVKIIGRRFLHSIDLQTETFEQERLDLWFQKGKLAYIELNIRLILKMLPSSFQILCSVDLDTLPAAWVLKKCRPVKLVFDAHEHMEEVPEVFDRPVTKWIWNQVGVRLLPAVDMAYTVSQSLVKEFRRLYQKDFGLVRNIAQLQPDEFEIPSPFGKGYWVFLGAVNRGRGLEEFLEVLPSTNRKLVILGTGDRLKAIKQLVLEKGMEHLVEFAGKVKPNEARTILQHAWAGLNLLTDEGLSYRYSLANKFFDYVHAGIPQICIDFQEYKWLNQEFEVAVLTSLEVSHLRAATELISMPVIQENCRHNAKNASLKWNWEKESAELISLYQKLGN